MVIRTTQNARRVDVYLDVGSYPDSGVLALSVTANVAHLYTKSVVKTVTKTLTSKKKNKTVLLIIHT